MKSQDEKHPISSARFFRVLLIFLADVFVICFSYFFALFVRFDCVFSDIPIHYLEGWLVSMPFWTAVTVGMFYLFHLYQSVWTFVGLVELKNLIYSFVCLIPFYVGISVATSFALGLNRMPYSYHVIGFALSFLGCCAVRFSYRFLRSQARLSERSVPREHVMIIGAGSAGQMLLRELATPRHRVKVCCLIDDNPEKKGRFLQGVEIVGGRYDILRFAASNQVTRIIFAIPSCSAEDRREILNICKEAGCKIQTVPELLQLQSGSGEISVRTLRDVDVTDLLGRQQIRVDNASAKAALGDKVVLVTGGGLNCYK